MALVLPTIVISMMDSGIAHTIDQTSQRYELLEETSQTSQTSEERRNFNGLVLDWYVAHGFAIVAIVAMIVFNIYAWIVINNYRQVRLWSGENISLLFHRVFCSGSEDHRRPGPGGFREDEAGDEEERETETGGGQA